MTNIFSDDQIFSLYCYRILTSFVARGEERPVPDNIMAAIVQLTQVTSLHTTRGCQLAAMFNVHSL